MSQKYVHAPCRGRDRSVLALMLALSCFSAGPGLASDKQKQAPKPGISARKAPLPYQEDVILVMPNAPTNEDKEELADTLRELNGRVLQTIGEGSLQVLVVQTPQGKMQEVEEKLSRDKHVAVVGRNYNSVGHLVPNDQFFPSQTHLGAINCPGAWDTSVGSNVEIAVFDSGCQESNPDLTGKTISGYSRFGTSSLQDLQGHGTNVSTTAAASFNNVSLTAGVAPAAKVYSVQIAGEAGSTNDLELIRGMADVLQTNKKIVNISYGSPPPTGLTNANVHGPLHEFFRAFHNKGGLVFISAGNDAKFDSNPRRGYLQVISAVDTRRVRASFSNIGTSVTFAAQGTAVVCSDRFGNDVSVNGTSFSCPIVAGMAALVWSRFPRLTNAKVLAALRRSTNQTVYNNRTGFGIPNAKRALAIARTL
jgi:thermitase